MSKERECANLLKAIMGKIPQNCFVAQVQKVDGATCTVVRQGDNLKIAGVRLNELSDESVGMVIKPKADSFVLVARIDDFNYYVSLYSEIDSVDIQCDKITINGGDNGGLINIEELKKQLDKMSKRIDTIIYALENSPTTAQDGGAGYKSGIVGVLEGITEKEDFTNMEDDKIKH